MIDEIYDRHYQAARSDLNAGIAAGIARLWRAIGNTFAVVHRIQYDVPWSGRPRRPVH